MIPDNVNVGIVNFGKNQVIKKIVENDKNNNRLVATPSICHSAFKNWDRASQYFVDSASHYIPRPTSQRTRLDQQVQKEVSHGDGLASELLQDPDSHVRNFALNTVIQHPSR